MEKVDKKKLKDNRNIVFERNCFFYFRVVKY